MALPCNRKTVLLSQDKTQQSVKEVVEDFANRSDRLERRVAMPQARLIHDSFQQGASFGLKTLLLLKHRPQASKRAIRGGHDFDHISCHEPQALNSYREPAEAGFLMPKPAAFQISNTHLQDASFYPQYRADGLTRRWQQGSKKMHTFKDRPDRLVYRSVRYSDQDLEARLAKDSAMTDL